MKGVIMDLFKNKKRLKKIKQLIKKALNYVVREINKNMD